MSQYGNIGQLNIDISANGDAAVQSLERLANVMSRLTFGDISGLKAFTHELKALAKIDLSNLRLDNVASSLQALNGINIEITGLAELVKTIRGLSGKSIDKAIANIPLLSTAINALMQDLSVVPMVKQNTIDMVNALANFSSQGSKVGSASKRIAKGLQDVEKQGKKTKGVLATIFSGINAGNFAGNLAANIISTPIKMIASFVSQKMNELLSNATGYASDIVETQNIIERTFGDNIGVIEDFSRTSLKMYGINELQAKKMTGIYQALGTSLGETKDRMAEVSTSLTALAADYASFFNMDIEKVSDDFTAIFTGQTKAMRKYGIDLTNAQLQDFANSQGWDVQVKSLTQYQKAIIRYNYLVNRSKDIVGDFQRTQMSFANQSRVLWQQLTEAIGQFGQIATAILKPILNILNQLVSQLLAFASALVSFLGINNFDFGGGAIESLDDSLEDVEDSATGAGKALKKMKQYTTSIDELNVLKPQEDSGGGVGSGGLNVPNLDWNSDWFKNLKGSEEDMQKFLDFFKGVKEILQPTIESLKNFKTEVLDPLGNVVWEGLKSLYSEVLLPISKLVFTDALPSFFNFLADIGKKLNWNSITKAVKGLVEVLGKVSVNIGKGLVNFFKSLYPILKPVIATTINAIAKAIELLTGVLKKIPNGIFEVIGRGIGVFLTYKAVAGIITTIAGAIIKLGSALMTLGQAKVLNDILPNVAANLFMAGDAVTTFGATVSSIAGVAAIIGAIAMAIYQLFNFLDTKKIEDTNKQLKKFGTSFEQIQEATDKVNSLSKAWENYKTGNSDITNQEQYIRNLADSYFELSKKENLTAIEEEKLKTYAGLLVGAVPELAGKIDTLTGAYIGTEEAIRKVIDRTLELANAEYIRKYVEEQAENVAKLELEYHKMAKAYEEATKDIDKNNEKQMAIAGGKLKAQMDATRKEIEDGKANIEDALSYKLTLDTKGAVEQVQATQSEIKNTLDNTPEEEKANIKIGTKIDEKAQEELGTKTTELVNTENEKLSQEENKLKMQTTLDTAGAEEGVAKIDTMVAEKGEELSTKTYEIGTHAMQSLGEGMMNGRTELSEITTENVTFIKNIYEEQFGISGDTSTIFEGYGKGMVQGLINGINMNKPIATEEITLWVNEIMTTFVGDVKVGINEMKWGEYATNIINGFVSGINKHKSFSLEAIRRWVKEIMSAFVGNETEGINATVWSEYAHQINLGFAEGINTWGYIAINAVRNWASEIMAAFESEMDIESPSKVFKGYGYFTVEGFNQGIEQSANSTYSIIDGWVDGIKTSMKAVEDFNIDISNTIKGLDNLTAKVNTQVDMSGFYNEIEKAQTMGMSTSLNTYSQNQQAIEINIPNITLEVDSREIARANYKGQKQLGYQIKK